MMRRFLGVATFILPLGLHWACAADTGDAPKVAETVTAPAPTMPEVDAGSPMVDSAAASNYGTGSSSPPPTDDGSLTMPAEDADANVDAEIAEAGPGNDASMPSAVDASSPVADVSAAAPDAQVAGEAGGACVGCSLSLLYQVTNADPMSAQVAFQFELKNTGMTTVNLATVTVQYYFKSEAAGALNYKCYYAQMDGPPAASVTNAVSGGFMKLPTPTANADTVLTVLFASGSVPPGQTVTVQNTVYDSLPGGGSTVMNQSNDYSFDPSKTVFTSDTKLTVFIGSTLAWGTPP